MINDAWACSFSTDKGVSQTKVEWVRHIRALDPQRSFAEACNIFMRWVVTGQLKQDLPPRKAGTP